MIKLNDLLQLSPDDLERTRIRFNRNSGTHDPIEEYKSNPDNLIRWNYWNSKSYKVGQISIGFVDMGNDSWLLFTVGEIESETGIKGDGVGWNAKEFDQYKDFYGRLVIRFHNNAQQLFRVAKDFIDQLEVKEILPSQFTGFDFPGYDNVCLSYKELETIVNGNYPSYQNALKNQKAVYLQTDLKTGKMYVGSATEKGGMLFTRWSSYVTGDHDGGNVGLKELVADKGREYIEKNFQYTILENFNSRVDDGFVLNRENYWKKVLATREHGYNRN